MRKPLPLSATLKLWISISELVPLRRSLTVREFSECCKSTGSSLSQECVVSVNSSVSVNTWLVPALVQTLIAWVLSRSFSSSVAVLSTSTLPLRPGVTSSSFRIWNNLLRCHQLSCHQAVINVLFALMFMQINFDFKNHYTTSTGLTLQLRVFCFCFFLFTLIVF